MLATLTAPEDFIDELGEDLAHQCSCTLMTQQRSTAVKLDLSPS